MAWTQADLDKLDAAISAGGSMQSMTFAGGDSFTFRTLDEMLKLRAVMQQAVSAASGTSAAHRLAAFSKGV
jgi:hypothetical protein